MEFKPAIYCGEERRKGEGDRRICSNGKRMDQLARSLDGVEKRKGRPDRRKLIRDVLGVGEEQPPRGGYQDSL
ncbi:MAG: hypothetical protein ABIH35_04320 [Patescibacteria group bacterium]